MLPSVRTARCAAPRSVAFVVLLLSALLAPASGCGKGKTAPEDIRRVVVLHLDTTRVDAIGCYGGHARTPAIDALCKRGRRYTNAISPTPLTSPSIASFMTGKLSHESGVYTVGNVVKDKLETLAEVLRRNGFATGGFTSNMVTANRSDGSSLGFDQGFDVYRAALDETPIPAGTDRRRFPRDNAAILTKEALAFVDQHANDRFFLWMLFIDPHAPYAPPAPYDTMYASDPALLGASRALTREQIGGQAVVEGESQSAYYTSRYYGEVSLVDRSIAELVARVDALPGKTLWIVTADHGESLGEQDRWFQHGKTLGHACVDVPLIVACDGCVPPGTSDALVANVDLAPTILDVLGVRAEPFGLHGRSLVPTFANADPWPDRMLPINVEHADRWRGVRTKTAVLQTRLQRPSGVPDQRLLYDLDRDPAETTNVAQGRPDLLRHLEKIEASWFLAREGEPAQDARTEYEMTERLRALGYLD